MSSSDKRAGLLKEFSTGLTEMSVELSPAQKNSLIDYLLLLERWNRVHNLTAIRRVQEMVGRHLLDSLSILPFIASSSVIDVGSGAGLPGIPIAVAKPEINCLMLDSNSRKTRFIQQAIASLKLTNAHVVHSRVNDFDAQSADCVVSRAFSSPVDIINICGHLCRPGGSMIFMMAHIGSQFDNLPDGYTLQQIHKVDVAGSDAIRHIAICIRQS